jgi:microcystin-dependent protein
MKKTVIFLVATTSAASANGALAGTAQPFDNLQPSLAVTELMLSKGNFPSRDQPGTALGGTLGFVYDFAGTALPGMTLAANGQTFPVGQNTALFSLLGNTYGGDGRNTFALPDLQGRAIIGAGAGAGLTPRTLGVAVGSPTVSLTPPQVPAPGALSASVPYNTIQPSLALQTLIAVGGFAPVEAGSRGTSAFVGQIANFAGNFAPTGWAPANGQLLSIADNEALVKVIGTTYGGDGTTNFRLPDLRGRIAIGADAANPIGSQKGAESITVTRSELPGASEQPLSDDQPSLAITYIIATTGIFPATFNNDSFDPTDQTLGQIAEFAGDFAPTGWALADGQLLSIRGNEALFSLFRTTYGGDGITTFALPNLDGRTTIGAGGVNSLGAATGFDQVFLTASQVSAVPESSTWAMMLIGFIGFSFAGYGQGRKQRYSDTGRPESSATASPYGRVQPPPRAPQALHRPPAPASAPSRSWCRGRAVRKRRSGAPRGWWKRRLRASL